MNWARAFGFTNGGIFGHTWSLAIEEQFYLVWPLVLLTMYRCFGKREMVGIAFLVSAVVIATYRACVVDLFSSQRVYFGLDTHADQLLLGSALASLLPRLRTVLSGDFASQASAYLLVPVAVFSLLVVMLSWTWQDPQMVILGYLVCGVASTVLIGDLVAGKHSLLRVPLSNRFLVFTGKISYGLYLWHFPIYDYAHTFDFIWGWKRLLLVGGTFSFLVAILSYRFVEQPFLRLKTRYGGLSHPDENVIEGKPVRRLVSIDGVSA